MSTRPVRLHRWDEIALEKVTEMISRKVVTGEREMIGQIYLKRGAIVPMHSHESEQLTYVLQGAMKFLIHGEEITVREGEGIDAAGHFLVITMDGVRHPYEVTTGRPVGGRPPSGSSADHARHASMTAGASAPSNHVEPP